MDTGNILEPLLDAELPDCQLRMYLHRRVNFVKGDYPKNFPKLAANTFMYIQIKLRKKVLNRRRKKRKKGIINPSDKP